MPSYRNGNDEYRRKPKTYYEREYEPEEDGYEEDSYDDKKFCKKPFFCKVECPFKVVVKLIPCDDHKRPTPM